MAIRLSMGFAVAGHAGEMPGRLCPFELNHPRVLGILSNTPYLIDGIRPVDEMRLAGVSGIERHPRNADLQSILQACLASMDTAMVELALRGTEASHEALWELGGSAGLVCAVDGNAAAARVGELRLIHYSGATPELLQYENTLAGDMRSSNHPNVAGAPLDIVTDYLGKGREAPPQVVSVSEGRLLFAPGPPLDALGEAALVSCLAEPSAARCATRVAQASRRARGAQTGTEPATIVVGVVDVRFVDAS